MRYGISAGALIVRDGRLLLVHHREEGQYDFWVPPGGRLEGEESILACARREAFEETGLRVEPGRIAYIQEFVQPGYHFCKMFVLCTASAGEITLEYREAYEGFLVDARFLAREELAGLVVHPEILKGQFWDDLASGFPRTRYLGLERIGERQSTHPPMADSQKTIDNSATFLI
jgi:ADP-ribose pyrophosphatase YjhB (NUDIX family)